MCAALDPYPVKVERLFAIIPNLNQHQHNTQFNPTSGVGEGGVYAALSLPCKDRKAVSDNTLTEPSHKICPIKRTFNQTDKEEENVTKNFKNWMKENEGHQ